MTKEEINNNDNSIKEDSNDEGVKDKSSKSKVKEEETLPEETVDLEKRLDKIYSYLIMIYFMGSL